MGTIQKRETIKPATVSIARRGHKSSKCKIVECVSDRRLKISEKKVVFQLYGIETQDLKIT